MKRGEATGRKVIVVWATECKATHKELSHLQSDHEEADTQIIVHALDATDTDVLVLAFRRYPEVCPNTSFVTRSATTRRTIKLQPIAEALGSARTAALLAFLGKERPTCWKEFEETNESILRSLANLGKDEKPDEETLDEIKEFVCQLYQPKATIKTVKELRWLLFKKRQAESDRLPPTKAALHQAILQAHYQLMVWNNDRVPNPVSL